MAKQGFPGTRVLVVDDSLTLRHHLVGQLHAMGMTVVEAGNGQEGLHMLTKEPVDLILTDLEMPEMDGFEFCEEVRKIPEQARTPMIVVSTYSDSHFITRALRLGADDFVLKPCDAESLGRAIRRATSSLVLEVPR